MCKQAHVIKRFLENNPQHMHIWDHTNNNPNNWRLVQEPMLKNIIYSTWNSSWFQTEKSTSDWSSEFDTWFINGYQDHRAHAIWREGIKYVAQNAQPYLKYKKDGTPDGLRYFSQWHYVGKINRQ